MSKKHLILLTFIGVLLANVGCTSSTSPVVVEGKIQLGQPKDAALAHLKNLGYELATRTAELQPDETLYRQVSNKKEDSENPRFVRVVIKDEKIAEVSGRPDQLSFDKSTWVFGKTSSTEIKTTLGDPSWEKNVGGATGICYRKLDLYLTTVEGKLSGFSLGDVPKEPD